MANELTLTRIESAYDIAVQVFEQKMTAKQGGSFLVSEGIGVAYAMDLINAYKLMRQGRCYQRTINVQATEYYLHRIFEDAGPESLALALGSTTLHIEYYEQQRKVNVLSKRQAVINAERLLKPSEKTLTQHLASFDAAVQVASSDDQSTRLARLKQKKAAVATKINLTTTLFVRDPDVVAEALYRAEGVCDACKSPAPFKRKSNDTPYLEVHHKVRLADGGLDVIENVVAVCPNCHRKAHFG